MADVPVELLELLRKLSARKLAFVSSIVTGLLGAMIEKRNEKSDLVTDVFLEEFGVHLLAHHGTATRPLTKEQFERAMERVMKLAGRNAQRSPVGNPGHDVTTVKDAKDNVKFALYFDGGTERKLQEKDLKKSLCIVHGEWDFSPA